MLSSSNYSSSFPSSNDMVMSCSSPRGGFTAEYEEAYLQFLQQLLYQQQDAENSSKKVERPCSKIQTARGPRDRRMRLSVDIARRFFHLQDLLGCDKASDTVDWLLTHARDAIADLSSSLPHTCQLQAPPHEYEDETKTRKRRRRMKKVVRVQVGKESRRMARERARERTSQKRRLANYSPLFQTPLEPIYPF